MTHKRNMMNNRDFRQELEYVRMIGE